MSYSLLPTCVDAAFRSRAHFIMEICGSSRICVAMASSVGRCQNIGRKPASGTGVGPLARVDRAAKSVGTAVSLILQSSMVKSCCCSPIIARLLATP
jgi:hypothetical protein